MGGGAGAEVTTGRIAVERGLEEDAEGLGADCAAVAIVLIVFDEEEDEANAEDGTCLGTRVVVLLLLVAPDETRT